MKFNSPFITLLVLCSPLSFANENNKPKQVIFKINEMTCQLCAYSVNKSLREVEGVIKTKASIAEREVTISAEPSVKEEDLVQAIEKLSYTAEQVEK